MNEIYFMIGIILYPPVGFPKIPVTILHYIFVGGISLGEHFFHINIYSCPVQTFILILCHYHFSHKRISFTPGAERK